MKKLFVGLLLLIVGCTDITAPLDRIDVQRALPCVVDIRVRLVLGIENSGVRDRVAYDAVKLEAALNAYDRKGVQYHHYIMTGILTDYRDSRWEQIWGIDQADVSAIFLCLDVVQLTLTNK